MNHNALRVSRDILIIANRFETHYFSKLTRKTNPAHSLFLICILSHRKFLVPKGLDVKEYKSSKGAVLLVNKRAPSSMTSSSMFRSLFLE